MIGGGPAGLMAAEQLARAGVHVTLIEAKPSIGRKFLMAGKSGLNLTKDEPLEAFCAHYAEAQDWLLPMLSAFGPAEVSQFAGDLQQKVFTGSTGRVFPVAMKASPMLRAWLIRLEEMGVKRHLRWRWIGWDGGALVFDTPEGRQSLTPEVTVFALGGASWSKLGSDGAWAHLFQAEGIACARFGPANAALEIDWSVHMHPHFGTPLKAVEFRAGALRSRGEAVLTAKGLEGGGVYAISRDIRRGSQVFVDLRPDWSAERLRAALAKPPGKASWSNHLRKTLKLTKLEGALLNEWARPIPRDPAALAALIKALPVRHAGLAPLDQAISTSGGVLRDELTEGLMLHQKPGCFCAGEMIDWEAPTGGYLLTACFATGRQAGLAAAQYIANVVR